MRNLNQLVIDKIKELGPTKAAAYFGVSVPTIYSWQKKNNAPVGAVQKVLDDEVNQDANRVRDIPPEAEVAPEVVAGEQATGLSLEERVTKLERFAVAHAERGAAQPSLVRPFRPPTAKSLEPPNSGMEVKTRAEVIGAKPEVVDSAPDWNEPKTAPRKGGGWNEPVNPVPPRNPANNWNRPMEKA